MKISIILGTGRDSYGTLSALEHEHYMLRTLKSIESQIFTDFELIVVDAVSEFRNLQEEINSLGNWSFPIRVISPFSWWWRMGMWSLQHSFNEGARVSVGDHLLFCGDCFEIDPHVLEESVQLLDKGLSPSLLYVYRRGGNLQRLDNWNTTSDVNSVSEAIKLGRWDNGEFKRDCRWENIKGISFMPPEACPWTWLFGYCFVRRDDFFYVNGWDENFDGDKVLGDVELGSRLQMAGRWKLCLNPSLYVYENYHHGISPSVFDKFNNKSLRAIRNNHDLILWHRAMGIWRANSTNIPNEVARRICRAEISGHMGWPDYKFSDVDAEWIYQKHWIENPSIFEMTT